VVGAIAAGLAVFAGLYGLFGVRRPLPARSQELIRASILSPVEWRRYQEQRRSLYERVVQPVVLHWGRRFKLRPVVIDRTFLVQAGIDPERMDGVELRTVKLAGAAGAGALALILSLAESGFLLLLPLGIWAGYVGPSWYLSARRRRRQDQARRELPDLVGVLKAFITAGLPLERALHLVSTQPWEGGPQGSILAAEIKLALGRYGLGVTIDQALEEMTARVGVDDVALFVGALTQGKRLGTGLERLLRDQEILVRMNQRNRATAEASRVGTKLMGVLAGVYLPEFVILIMIPLFWGIMRRAFG